MALITADRVREFTSTNGTGAFTLTGAAVGYQTFASAIGSGNTCYYAVYNPGVNEWEVGIGTVGTGVLARTTVLKSSNSDTLVDFSAGTKDVFVTYPAEYAVFQGGNFSGGTLSGTTITGAQVNITGQGDLRLEDTTGGEYVALQAPGTLASSYTLTMPVDDGTPGQALVTDGSGNLSWSTAASGDVYGPASATDKAVVRFDSTTGKIIQNSGVIIDNSNNVTGVASFTASADSSFTSTGALLISKGTTGEQPGSPAVGMMRYNTSTNQFEGYSGASPAWKSIGGSALSNDTSTATNLYPVFAASTTGTAENLYTSNANYLYKPSTGELQAKILAANTPFIKNTTNVTANYTTEAGYNTMSTGPITVDSGIVVTVTAGTVWTII